MSKPLHLLAAFGAAALLAACGGGDGPAAMPDAVPDTVPSTATASPEAFTQYAAALTDDDRREPLVVDGLMPPTSETAEPLAVAR